MTTDRKQSFYYDPLMLGKRAQRVRVEKHLSIESLAQQAGLNKNTIVRFEKGLSTRMDTIYKICNVLSVSPFQLLDGKLVKGRDYAIKKHIESGKVQRHQRVPDASDAGMTTGDLHYKLPGGDMAAKVIEVRSRSTRRSHPGEELLFCLTGTIGVEISDVKVTLNKGDALFFWGTEPHVYFNADGTKAVSVALSIVNSGDEINEE
ncbi:helix-turn-helix transcriptional regulator [candidate division KSB1 bacterium]|nr:helix-turn-helix transcriptional regulator [candidate division KSB1 bacterium]